MITLELTAKGWTIRDTVTEQTLLANASTDEATAFIGAELFAREWDGAVQAQQAELTDYAAAWDRQVQTARQVRR